MADWQNRRIVEYRRNELGFVVRLVDAFTGGRTDGDPRISLRGLDETPVENQSGYHVFLNLDTEVVDLVVDGGEIYFDEERTVVLPGGDERVGDESTVILDDRWDPVVVELTPTPAFPFPDGTTLVTGHVTDEDGEPVADATVAIPEFDVTTKTTETGEYALSLRVGSENVVKKDGRKLVTVDAPGTGNGRAITNGGDHTDPTIQISHPDHDTVTEHLEVEGGAKTVHYVTLP